MAQEIEYVQFPITKGELLSLSIYLMDKDNDIEGYGIDEVVDKEAAASPHHLGCG